MAVKKISELAAYADPLAGGDEIPVVDLSDTSSAASGTTKRVTVTQLLGGAVYPSGDTTGAADTAAINAALDGYGVALLAAGTFNITPGSITAGPGQAIRGQGAGASILLVRGGTAGQAGLTFRNASFPTSGDAMDPSNLMGWSGGFTVDGTNATAGVHGIEIGDIYLVWIMGFLVRQFNGAGSIGLYFNNTIGWTERIFVQGHVSHAATCVAWDRNDAGGGLSTTSFAYSTFNLTVRCQANQTGYSWRGGVSTYACYLFLGGNFQSGNGSNTAVALDFGTDNSGPTIHSGHGSMSFEVNGTQGAPYVNAADINIGTGASIKISGSIIFRGGTWVAGSYSASSMAITTTGFFATQGAGNAQSRMRKVAAASVAVGVNSTPGAALTIGPDGYGFQSLAPAAVWWTTAGVSGETITLTVTSTYNDGTTATQTDTQTASSTKSWNQSQLGGMYKPYLALKSLSVTAFSNLSSTSATVAFSFAGMNAL